MIHTRAMNTTTPRWGQRAAGAEIALTGILPGHMGEFA